MSDDYTPIDCTTYSEYELAIIRRWALRVSWDDTDGTSHIALLKPRDLQTRDRVEYLIAEREDGERIEIRLDRIRGARQVDVRPGGGNAENAKTRRRKE